MVPEKKQRCLYSPGVFQGVRFEGSSFHGVSVQLPCNSWDCPVCNAKKLAQVRARIFNGDLFKAAMKKGYRDQYNQKFLTLTVPGQEYRQNHSPGQALDHMNSSFNKLRTAMRKKYGWFAFFRILEKQRDGYPHFHVLLSGQNIARKEVLEYIETMWQDEYGLGFVRLNVITNDLLHGIRYATKYLTKRGTVKTDRLNIKRHARLFSSSRGALQKREKKKKYDVFNKVYFGAYSSEEFVFIDSPALDVSIHVRDGCTPKIRYRVLQDEIKALEKLKDVACIKY
jgi:hypothetical protein